MLTRFVSLAILVCCIFMLHIPALYAQGVGINANGLPPHPSAMLDVDTKIKGLLIPRLTESERNLIVNPAQGLLILNTTTGCINMYWGVIWRQICFDCAFGNITISSNSPVCAGASLQLNAPTVAGASYQWSGPNGFSSTAQNPTIPSVSLSNAGTYTLIVSANGCNSVPVQTTISVAPAAIVPTATAATSPNLTGFTANWGSVSGAVSYELDVSTQANFSSFVPGFNAFNVGNVTSYTLSGLTNGTQYYYRVRAITSNCGASASSNTINVVTNLPTTQMQWVDPATGSCNGQIYLTMQSIAAAMPSTPHNVRIFAQQVSPTPNFGTWTGTFLNTTCVKQFLTTWGTRTMSPNSICTATDTAGVSYNFYIRNDGANSPQVFISPTSAPTPTDYMKIYLLDRTGAWCDLAGTNNRPGFDPEVNNSNTSGVAGDRLVFTWW